MKLVPLVLLALAWTATAGTLDGKWSAELNTGATGAKKAAGFKGGKKPAGGPRRAAATLDLKSDGNQLSGSVIQLKGKHARPVAIQDGKIDGDHFSFTTVQKAKKGDVKLNWQGSLNGEQITGTRGRDGAKRGVPFTAKRQG
jgi:hypothetical protein